MEALLLLFPVEMAISPVEFEPGATNLEKEGSGYVVASLGVDSGYVPYTAFSAKESYIKKHPDLIQSFTNALQKGMTYVNNHSAAEIAKVIAPQFKDTDEATIAMIVERYQKQDTWKDDLVFTKDSYELLLDILEEAGVLTGPTALSGLDHYYLCERSTLSYLKIASAP